RVLRQTSGFTLVGYVAGHAPVGAVLADSRPDVVIVDDLGAPPQAVKRIADVHAALPESSATHEALGLTQRELELLRLVASGATNNRLAGQLFVTEQTVKFHLSNIYRKLGVANRTQASRFAYSHGLVPTAVAPDADTIDDVVMRAA